MNDWDRWVALWRELGRPADRAVFEELLARYAEPHRAYHTLEHVRDCLSELEDARHLSQRPAELELAVWFHDAVYDPRRYDNEERSAQRAYRRAIDQGLDEDAAARVRDLILATRHDAAPVDTESALLVDVDLSILGRPAVEFDRYEAQIRREYAWAPEPVFCKKRAEILRAFLERSSIYWTDHFRGRYEQRARLNLRRSLASLGCIDV